MFYTCTILITLLYTEACGRLVTQDCKQTVVLSWRQKSTLRLKHHQKYIKTHQHKHQRTLKNIIRKKIQLLKSGLEQSHWHQQLQMATRADSRFQWLYETLDNTDWCTLVNAHRRLRLHQEVLMSRLKAGPLSSLTRAVSPVGITTILTPTAPSTWAFTLHENPWGCLF